MVTIDDAYQLVKFVANKEQRGNITPSNFNLLAKFHQLQFVSKRLGNIKILDQRGVPQYGYESTWRIHEDLRPLIYGPIQIPIDSQGNFNYPDGYVWPDAVHKNDFVGIKRIDADQYPVVKNSLIFPPTSDYPIVIFRGTYGFIDPYGIGSFKMSYLKLPPDPIWAFTGDPEVYNPGASVQFSVPQLDILEICRMILQDVGINLDSAQITQYAAMKEAEGS